MGNGSNGSGSEGGAQIAADLAGMTPIFDLSRDGLGASAVGIIRDGILSHFDAEVDPDGVPWDKLSPRYRAWKEKHWPGNPINVRQGLMRSELEVDGAIGPATADYTPGRTEEGTARIGYSQEGDPEGNRPPRRIVGLTPEATSDLDQLFDNTFDRRMPR